MTEQQTQTAQDTTPDPSEETTVPDTAEETTVPDTSETDDADTRPRTGPFGLSRHTWVTVLGVMVIVVVALSAIGFRVWTAKDEDRVTVPSLTAAVGERSVEVPPYSVCDLDNKCEEKDAPAVLVVGPQDTLRLEIPASVADANNWSVIIIRQDDQDGAMKPGGPIDPHAGVGPETMHFTPRQNRSVEIPGSTAERGALKGVEVQSSLLRETSGGADTAYMVAWSLKTTETVAGGTGGTGN